MKQSSALLLLFALINIHPIFTVRAQVDSVKTGMTEVIKNSGIDITGQWFLAFQQQHNDQASTRNAFILRRGYITFSKDLSKRLAVRFTQDIITDEEGDDAGNIEMRLKYCYLKVKPFVSGVLEQSYLEAGMVHRPYLDFEEKINGYRLQGTMFLERNKVINSADFGVTFVTLLGGKLDKQYMSGLTSSYPGKFGSIALGVYNGGGYHALESNKNKTLEGRVSLRPFAYAVPGLQCTYAFAYGKGNTATLPDFRKQIFFLSYESKWTRTGVQYLTGKGNMAGTFLTSEGKVADVEGFSAFNETFIIHGKLATFFRYDYFKTGSSSQEKQRLISGITWYFYKNNKLLIDYDIMKRSGGYDRAIEAVIEIVF